MKKLLMILVLFSHFLAFGQDPKLKITPVSSNIFVYESYNLYQGNLISANAMYVLTEKGAILFDTPWDSTQFQPLLDSIEIKHKQKVIFCLATHSHADRAGGLDFYKKKGIKTYTSKQTDLISKQENSPRAEFIFENDTTFKFGDYTFLAYYGGAGHTVDNIVVWIEKEKLLYGGCLVKSTEATNLGYIGEAKLDEWDKTIKKIQKKFKKPKYIITGHQDWRNVGSLDYTLKLLAEHKKKNK